MSKTITSPVKRFPGTVTLSDPLTYPQVMAFEESLRAIQSEDKDELTEARVYALALPGVITCVERWNLAGVGENPTPETFPATPRKSSAEVIAWLIGEITSLYRESEEIPNA